MTKYINILHMTSKLLFLHSLYVFGLGLLKLTKQFWPYITKTFSLWSKYSWKEKIAMQQENYSIDAISISPHCRLSQWHVQSRFHYICALFRHHCASCCLAAPPWYYLMKTVVAIRAAKSSTIFGVLNAFWRPCLEFRFKWADLISHLLLLSISLCSLIPHQRGI